MSESEWLPPDEDAALWAQLHAAMQREAALFRWLVAHPVRIVLLRRLPRGVRGIYKHGPTPEHARILLDASQPAGSMLETFWHETGHHLHRTERTRVDGIIKDAFARVKVPACPMTGKNSDEMFAEALSARVTYFRDRFDSEYPIEGQCVRDVLKAVGIE